jgi:hypothetical protein
MRIVVIELLFRTADKDTRQKTDKPKSAFCGLAAQPCTMQYSQMRRKKENGSRRLNVRDFWE